MKNGKYIDSDGSERWYKNGLYHREDGPAIIWTDGSESWYKNGQRHREDGPAVTYAAGSKHWYKNGLLHREDGPAAIIAPNAYEYWFVLGHPVDPFTPEEYPLILVRLLDL